MPLLTSLQQFDIDPVDFLTILFTGSLLLFFVLAALCGPLAALVTEGVYAVSRKAFYDKCALQMGQSSLASGLFIFLVACASTAAAFYAFQPEMLSPPLIRRPLAVLSAPLAALCLLALYLATWAPLKKLKPPHLLLGLLTALFCLAVFFSGFLLLGSLQQPMLPILFWDAPLAALRLLLEDFLLSPHQWLMVAFLFCTGLAAAGGLAQIWLIVRRFKADYGRDYYAFAMRHCARAALLAALAADGLAATIFFRLKAAVPREFSQPEDICIMIMAYGLPLVSCLLWLFVVKSDTPLRHKAGVLFACLFLALSICAQFLSVLNTFPLV